MNLKNIVFISAASFGVFAFSSCNSVQDQQSHAAYQAAQSLTFTDNSEIKNITKRLQLTSNPGQIGFIVLFAPGNSTPVAYYGVKGKITSGSKRLTNDASGSNDEGTYGSSDPYVYFWDQNGNYHQFNGQYLYSDKPIRLSVKPLVISETQ